MANEQEGPEPRGPPSTCLCRQVPYLHLMRPLLTSSRERTRSLRIRLPAGGAARAAPVPARPDPGEQRPGRLLQGPAGQHGASDSERFMLE